MSGGPRLLLLTPVGRAGVACLQLLGARGLASPLVDRAGGPRAWPGPGEVAVVHWVQGVEALDECVVVGRPDGVEVHVHGGAGVLARIADSLGLELEREPVQAPRGSRAVRAVASRRWGWMAELCADAAAALASGAVSHELRERARCSLDLRALGARLAAPPRVRLVGQPNAGKSTLFNALLGETRALVSAWSGTTRDAVSARMILSGVEVILEDTAGRDSGEQAPAEGADLLLQVRAPGGEPLTVAVGGPPCVAALTHADQADAGPVRAGEHRVSGVTGLGVPALAEALGRALGLEGGAAEDVRAPLDGATVALLEGVLDAP